jgi:6-phosphogluconate dehydrogenase
MLRAGRPPGLAGMVLWIRYNPLDHGEGAALFQDFYRSHFMKIGMVGLGKMGGNMARRLLHSGIDVVGFNATASRTEQIAREDGLVAAYSLEELVQKLDVPHRVWMMLPAGEPTENTILAMLDLLSPGDVLVDGGNSNYKDSQRRAQEASMRGVHFVDVGTSGGIWGLSEGYSMMVGGEAAGIDLLRPVLQALAPTPQRGWGHVGPSGAGHFSKMIHNGIEYGLMQAYAEGFEIVRAKKELQIDLYQLAEIWRYGSVIRSWLLDLTAIALAEDPELSDVQGWVADSGEGRWTVMESIDLDVPASVITLALQKRFASRQDESYAAKLLAALRNQFGGHDIHRRAQGS